MRGGVRKLRSEGGVPEKCEAEMECGSGGEACGAIDFS